MPNPADVQAFVHAVGAKRHRYAYVLNNPLKYVDPTGHFEVPGPYIDPGTDCYRWCGGAASLNPRAVSTDERAEQERRQKQVAGFIYGAMESVPYADTPNDTLVATTGCGYRCQAGYEKPVGWFWRGVAATGIIGPWGYRFVREIAGHAIHVGSIVRYGSAGRLLKGTNTEAHHAVMDVWGQFNLPNYNSRSAPAIVLTDDQHNATRRAFISWRIERTGSPTGHVDWSAVTAEEIYQLSERMFDAAGVPADARAQYYRAFNQYIYGDVTYDGGVWIP